MTTNEKLDEMIDILDSLVHAACSPMRYEEVVACEKKLIMIETRVQLVLSFLDTHEPQPFKMWRGT